MNKNKEIAGNLYIHNSSDYLSQKELQYIINSTEENFDNAGINFQKIELLQEKQFPPLEKLDILIYMLDFFGNRKESQTPASEAQFIIGEDDLIQRLKEELDIPYDFNTSAEHTGFVNSEEIILQWRKELTNKDFLYESGKNLENLSRDEIVKMIAFVLTHEVGHGIGAAHVWLDITNPDSPKKSIDHFMGEPLPYRKRSWHPENINIMQEFIHKVKSGEYETLIELRQKLAKPLYAN